MINADNMSKEEIMFIYFKLIEEFRNYKLKTEDKIKLGKSIILDFVDELGGCFMCGWSDGDHENNCKISEFLEN